MLESIKGLIVPCRLTTSHPLEIPVGLRKAVLCHTASKRSIVNCSAWPRMSTANVSRRASSTWMTASGRRVRRGGWQDPTQTCPSGLSEAARRPDRPLSGSVSAKLPLVTTRTRQLRSHPLRSGGGFLTAISRRSPQAASWWLTYDRPAVPSGNPERGWQCRRSNQRPRRRASASSCVGEPPWPQ